MVQSDTFQMQGLYNYTRDRVMAKSDIEKMEYRHHDFQKHKEEH